MKLLLNVRVFFACYIEIDMSPLSVSVQQTDPLKSILSGIIPNVYMLILYIHMS